MTFFNPTFGVVHIWPKCWVETNLGQIWPNANVGLKSN